MKQIVSMASMVLALALLLGGCATAPSTSPSSAPLMIGVTADYPPVIYKQGTQVVGIEADLARRLGAELKRPVFFVELAWDDLVPALLDNRIDIIMSGMSVNKERQVRITFSNPYMTNSLVAVVERNELANYPTTNSILESAKGVGVLKGSTADRFVTRHIPDANKTFVDAMSDVNRTFEGNRIRVFIGDIFAVAWLVSENEATLAGIWTPLHQEPVAWGFRNDDVALRESVNQILAGWKKDGTLKSILKPHVPYLDRIPWEAP